MDKKAKFYQIYANLPLGARSEIVAIIDNEPISWNAAYIEIENNTSKAEEILNRLVELEIIKEEDKNEEKINAL